MPKSSFPRSAAVAALLLIVSCNDHGLEPAPESTLSETVGISGTITYLGDWPDTTAWVRLAVFDNMPANFLEIITSSPIISDTLPRFQTTYDYALALPPGRYEWVVLAWRPEKPCVIEIDSVKVCGLDTLGMYVGPGNSTVPQAIEVLPDQLLTGIDIVADFSRLVPPSPIIP